VSSSPKGGFLRSRKDVQRKKKKKESRIPIVLHGSGDVKKKTLRAPASAPGDLAKKTKGEKKKKKEKEKGEGGGLRGPDNYSICLFITKKGKKPLRYSLRREGGRKGKKKGEEKKKK